MVNSGEKEVRARAKASSVGKGKARAMASVRARAAVFDAPPSCLKMARQSVSMRKLPGNPKKLGSTESMSGMMTVGMSKLPG